MSDKLHPRTIIQLDVDYFYAQAEEVLDPTLKTLPVAIQQKVFVTCNYVARSYGINKLELLTDAKKKCRDLRIIDGSDITRYRRYSRKIFELVKYLLNGEAASDETGAKWIVKVERLGFDELFMDVTDIIGNHICDIGDGEVWPDGQIVFKLPGSEEAEELAGHWAAGFSYRPDTFAGHRVADAPSSSSSANLTLQTRYIQIATHLASHIRSTIHAITGFTTSGGIAHNKLFAKLAANVKKPNGMTYFLPGDAAMEFLDKVDIRSIAGIGSAVRKVLRQNVPNLEHEANDALAREQEDNDTQVWGGEIEDMERDMFVPPSHSTPSVSTPPSTEVPEDDAMANWRFSRTVAEMKGLVSMDLWKEWFGSVAGQKYHDLLNGIDNSPVVPTTWPAQIGVEDAFRHCSTFEEAKARLLKLATMLVERVQEEEYLEEKRKWRRVVRCLRLTIRRRRKGNERGWQDDRETRTCTAPVELQDANTPILDRATILIDNAVFPLFKRMVSVPVKDLLTLGDGFDLTLLNISAVDMRKEGVSRSIREFMTAQPIGEVDEGERRERRLRSLGIDLEVFEELPEEIRKEILGGGEGVGAVGGGAPGAGSPVVSTPVGKRKTSGAGGSAKRVKGPLDRFWGKMGSEDSGITEISDPEGSSSVVNEGAAKEVEGMRCDLCGETLTVSSVEEHARKHG
ncbi:hypothetical protein HK097_006841 [Rhizophlyctis rosea]|uniref:UmuC domain-containing protein n=1 Tax=Rhizophlyctis rosea TaxID=64517 RepID=A0AAD5SFK4_9FUNG|nr:hypothetical protein HK097_006841 [Rhizophlyctis rosea]